jgi:hypothetical protein
MRLWDVYFEYRGKRIAADVRSPENMNKVHESYDDSLKLLASTRSNCLVFVFAHELGPALRDHMASRNSLLEGAVRIVVADKVDVEQALIRIANEVAGPSTPVS